ncbi:MAG: hypothetical protein AAF456_19505 [Planctomycetota bacterium]
MFNNQIESFVAGDDKSDYLRVLHPEPNIIGADIELLFPGSFNPVHEGHRKMAEIAAEKSGMSLWFELSIINVDKQPPSASQLEKRLRGDFSPHGLVLTRAARFTEKAALFPECTFVVGADTLIRINDQRYYQTATDRSEAFDDFARHQCQFLTFARKIDNIVIQGSNVELDDRLQSLCEHIPADVFMMDVASREIRSSND